MKRTNISTLMTQIALIYQLCSWLFFFIFMVKMGVTFVQSWVNLEKSIHIMRGLHVWNECFRAFSGCISSRRQWTNTQAQMGLRFWWQWQNQTIWFKEILSKGFSRLEVWSSRKFMASITLKTRMTSSVTAVRKPKLPTPKKKTSSFFAE